LPCIGIIERDFRINRIIAFIEDHSSSQRFNDIVGSHLQFVGDRLDAIFKATQKGSHATIINKEEADRYVVYTYLVTPEILRKIQLTNMFSLCPNNRYPYFSIS